MYILKRIAFSLLLVFAICALPSPLCLAQVVSSNVLIEEAKKYDGQEIEFSGEVVGEAMKRGEFSWVNVYDNFNAIGIWLKADKANLIEFFGDYNHKGDTILIKGIFHRACPEHGGDLDMHAISLAKITGGYLKPHRLPKEKIDAAAGLLIILLITAIIAAIRQKRKGKHTNA